MAEEANKQVNPQAGGWAGQLVGTGLGLALNEFNQRQQLQQQRKLQALQIKGSKEMADYNQQLAMQMWENTNYAAQRKQMEKAGLNVGLMYEGGGPGGTTQQGTGGSPSGGQAQGGIMAGAGMGMQLAMQMEMMKAQIENIKADTKVKNTDAGAKAVGIAQTEAAITKLKAETEGTDLANAIMVWEKELKKIEVQKGWATYNDLIKQVGQQTQILEQEIKSKSAAANVDEATVEARIQTAKLAAIETGVRIAAGRQGLIKTNADINAVNQGIAQIVQAMDVQLQENERQNIRMSQQQWEVWIKNQLMENEKAKTDFNTSLPEHIKQWTEILTGFIPLTRGGGKK